LLRICGERWQKFALAVFSVSAPGINEESVTFADDGHRALLETIKTPMVDKSSVSWA